MITMHACPWQTNRRTDGGWQ